MAFVIGLLLLAVSLDWAISCKPVNFKYKHFGYKNQYPPWAPYTEGGCKKGCFSWLNDTDGDFELKDAFTDDQHYEQKTCHPCGDITTSSYGADEIQTEIFCNDQITCHWKKGKCGFASCPTIVARAKCFAKGSKTLLDDDGNFVSRWRDGKCKEEKEYCGHCSITHALSEKNKTQCEWKCKHPDYADTDPKCYPALGGNKLYKIPGECVETQRYEYQNPARVVANKKYECLYAAGNPSPYVSNWSIWAFVVTLVFLILFALAVIGGIAFLIYRNFKREPTKE